MGSQLNLIVPSKFLSLVAHLTMLVIALQSKDTLIKGSVHPDEDDEAVEYSQINASLMRGLILALCMVGIEFVIFLYGISFFMFFLSTIETTFHIVGTILLALCVMDTWHIDTFWWIFWIGSAAPFTLMVLACIKHTIRYI